MVRPAGGDMKRGVPLLVGVLRVPDTMASLDLADWDLLLRQAAHSDMSAILLALAEERGLLPALPAPAREQLEWQRAQTDRHRQAVLCEVAHLARVLVPLGMPLVLLKGGAYALSGMPLSRGRLFSDIDILVPFERLGEVEAALMLDGWVTSNSEPYDQRYYREWMHELPPMLHVKRKSSLDVHHAILPRTAAAKPDSNKLLAAARPLPGKPDIHVLAPVDMVLHSAVHLFYEGEFQHGLRGLVDIHRLLGQFGAQPGFWDALATRAREFELERSLFYALRYSMRMLQTAVPAQAMQAVDNGRPGRVLLALMDQLFCRVLLPAHPSCADAYSTVSRFALYIRGNWLRMPPVLLARHLLHKAFLTPKAATPA